MTDNFVLMRLAFLTGGSVLASQVAVEGGATHPGASRGWRRASDPSIRTSSERPRSSRGVMTEGRPPFRPSLVERVVSPFRPPAPGDDLHESDTAPRLGPQGSTTNGSVGPFRGLSGVGAPGIKPWVYWYCN